MGIYFVFDFNKLEYFNFVKVMGKKGYYILKFFFLELLSSLEWNIISNVNNLSFKDFIFL